MEPNPWKFWLEDFPAATYQGMIPQGTPAFTDYWRSKQGDLFSQYQGSLAKQVMGGQPPTGSFSDYLMNYDWNRQWNLMSPQQRGINTSRFAPGLTWRV